MPTVTLKRATKELGISPNDIVRYHINGSTAVIEIDFKKQRKEILRNKIDPIFELGKNPVSSGISDGSVNHDKYIYQNDR